jgi:hypothetical protein
MVGKIMFLISGVINRVFCQSNCRNFEIFSEKEDYNQALEYLEKYKKETEKSIIRLQIHLDEIDGMKKELDECFKGNKIKCNT